MNKFQQKIRLIKKRLRHERREYKKRPESYPSFAEEWKTFWCNRFEEIQAAGKEDPHDYDYRKDWMRYWLVRVKQIYKERYKRLKAELMENLGISKERKNKNVSFFLNYIYFYLILSSFTYTIMAISLCIIFYSEDFKSSLRL